MTFKINSATDSDAESNRVHQIVEAERNSDGPAGPLKILVSGHACAPLVGSEPGITWNIAWELAKQHYVWVLVHPQSRSEIEEYLAQHPNPNLTFEYVSLPSWLDTWNPSKGERGIRLHYLIWQRAALHAAKRLHRKIGFDIAHYVSWGTVNAVPLLWRLPLPFVWGPIGGGQTAPTAFWRYFGPRWKREVFRNARVGLRQFSPSLRRAVQNTALILTINNETKRLVEKSGAKYVLPFLYGVSEEWFKEAAPRRAHGGQVVLQWSGRLEAHKGLPLLLEAMAATKDINVRLRVSGRGPEEHHCRTLCKKLAIEDRVEFLGFLPTVSDVLHSMRSADVFIMTSLQESFGSVVLEAMAQGLPVIVLDHQGMGTLIPPEVGWKIPVTNPSETVASLAAAIRHMASDPAERHKRGDLGLQFIKAHSWPLRVQYLEQLYWQLLPSAKRLEFAGSSKKGF